MTATAYQGVSVNNLALESAAEEIQSELGSSGDYHHHRHPHKFARVHFISVISFQEVLHGCDQHLYTWSARVMTPLRNYIGFQASNKLFVSWSWSVIEGSITKGGHNGCEDDNAHRLSTELSNWILIYIFSPHRPPCEEKNHPCKKIQQRLQSRRYDCQRPALHRRKNLYPVYESLSNKATGFNREQEGKLRLHFRQPRSTLHQIGDEYLENKEHNISNVGKVYRKAFIWLLFIPFLVCSTDRTLRYFSVQWQCFSLHPVVLPLTCISCSMQLRDHQSRVAIASRQIRRWVGNYHTLQLCLRDLRESQRVWFC